MFVSGYRVPEILTTEIMSEAEQHKHSQSIHAEIRHLDTIADNLKAFVPVYSWAKLSQIASKNNANFTLGSWKKIINKFPTRGSPS